MSSIAAGVFPASLVLWRDSFSRSDATACFRAYSSAFFRRSGPSSQACRTTSASVFLDQTAVAVLAGQTRIDLVDLHGLVSDATRPVIFCSTRRSLKT